MRKRIVLLGVFICILCLLGACNYMGLYSYTYSAGLTVATAVARRIEKEGAPAVEDWKNVLRAGSTLDPIGLAALAKVDITTDKPLNDAIDYIGSIIDEIIALTDELGE